ncbi:hypothetical protein B0O99DRAFT_606705 [Bisporella sp. PMI_857]|nr:hypothetical protein B0O99DRAFT_606705 [Bisporella sp. PMI_857]
MVHVLLLGGHGKVSLLLTPRLLRRGWNVTSLIRNPEQKSAIESAAGTGHAGKLNVIVESLEDVKSESDAKNILDKVKPEWVVWSAGAGGKGGKERTYAIDRDAAVHFIRASVASRAIGTFLTVSALSSRHHKAPWWDQESWDLIQKMNKEVLPDYYKAKLAADEVLTVLGGKRREEDGKFRYIVLRPGHLTDEEAAGEVSLGRTKAKGGVSRADVAGVAAELLGNDGASGWYDLLDGKEKVEDAVARVVKEGIDDFEGEDLEAYKKDVDS